MRANALSVDVEDWFQVYALEPVVDRSTWDQRDCRVERNTDHILELFAGGNAKATFFTLGWVAERYPMLMRRIVDAGHEIASHGYDHRRIYTMDAEIFRADVIRAKRAIEDASGVEVTGYRAPSFSFDARTPWAHAVLAETGHRYSSSIAPLAHDHYGMPEAPRHAYRPLSDSDLVELPVTIGSIFGKDFVTGGGYFRLLPSELTYRTIERENGEADRPAIFYFHPWEVDPGQPRLPGTPLKSRLRHYSRLGAMSGKLDALVRRYRWDRMDRVVAAEASRLS